MSSYNKFSVHHKIAYNIRLLWYKTQKEKKKHFSTTKLPVYFYQVRILFLLKANFKKGSHPTTPNHYPEQVSFMGPWCLQKVNYPQTLNVQNRVNNRKVAKID